MSDRNEFTQQLARNIKKARESKQISQEELADKAGLYRTYVGHIENARYSPSAFVTYKISQALKISLAELLKGK